MAALTALDSTGAHGADAHGAYAYPALQRQQPAHGESTAQACEQAPDRSAQAQGYV